MQTTSQWSTCGCRRALLRAEPAIQCRGKQESVHHIEPLVEAGQQFRNFFVRALQIVVERDDDFMTGCANAAKQGVVLTMVAAHANATHPRVVVGQSADRGPGIVTAAVFDKDDFKAGAASLEHGQEPFAERLQRALRSVDRHHDADVRRTRCERGWHLVE